MINNINNQNQNLGFKGTIPKQLMNKVKFLTQKDEKVIINAGNMQLQIVKFNDEFILGVQNRDTRHSVMSANLKKNLFSEDFEVQGNGERYGKPGELKLLKVGKNETTEIIINALKKIIIGGKENRPEISQKAEKVSTPEVVAKGMNRLVSEKKAGFLGLVREIKGMLIGNGTPSFD